MAATGVKPNKKDDDDDDDDVCDDDDDDDDEKCNDWLVVFIGVGRRWLEWICLKRLRLAANVDDGIR